MNTPARRWLGSRLVRRWSVVLATLGLLPLSPTLFAQQADSLAPFSYQNRVYNPVPAPVPGLAGSPQPTSVALFSGNVGAAGAPTTPNNGSFYLVQSSFAQPVAEPRNADFLLGEAILPDPALQVDLSKPPVIDPPVKAFYLADVRTVFASDAGLVEITWRRADNTPVGPVQYLIDRQPVRDPVGLYHTHNPSPGPGSDFRVNPLPVPQTKSPLVDVSGVQQTLFHWNSALPEDLLNPYLIRTPNGTLYAKDRTGLILVEYRENGQFLGIEIVALRSNLTLDGPPTKVDLGSRLEPFVTAADPAPPVVIRGLGSGTPETQFLYLHAKQPSPQAGFLFAIRRTGNPEDIEIYWTLRGLRNVVWPYELHRYTADWPAVTSKYQIYVRGRGGVLGPDVRIPAGTQAALMPFQEPATHANQVADNSFSTIGAGWSLLKYDQGDAVSFEAVRSVLHNDPLALGGGPGGRARRASGGISGGRSLNRGTRGRGRGTSTPPKATATTGRSMTATRRTRRSSGPARSSRSMRATWRCGGRT